MFGLDQLLKVIDPAPILVDHQACLHARHQRSACRACLQICPHQALSAEGRRVEADSTLCVRCGLCAGACPTAAITIRGLKEETVLAAAEVRCSEAGGSGPYLPCLGWLTPDHLVAMGLRHGKVSLVCGDCEACRWTKGGAMAAAAVELANEAFMALGHEAAVTLGRPTAAGSEGASTQRSVSRRELLALWTTEGTQIAKQLLPEAGVNPARLPSRVPLRRADWVKRSEPARAKADAHMPAGARGWKARSVRDNCNACGVCAAFCPTGALAETRTETGWVLTHQPAACVGCGACTELCPVGAVGSEPPSAQEMTRGTVREVARRVRQTCAQCHRPFTARQGETVCPQCKTLAGILGI
jgi:ferredoxin